MNNCFTSFKTVLFFVALTVHQFSGYGQRLDMKFVDPFKEQSLTNTFTTSIAQDSLGVIWIGTQEGLNSYNGYDINKYKHDPLDSQSLVNNHILDLFIDKSGKLWIATNTGLCTYNGLFDNFDIVLDHRDFKGLISPYITSINQDRDSVIYVSTERFLYQFDPSTQTFQKIMEIGSGEISRFIFDEHNNIWISGVQGGGLTYFDRKEKSLRNFKNDPFDPKSLSNNDVTDITFYHDKLWIATSGGGINSMNLLDYTFKRYPSKGNYDMYAVDLFVDQEDRLWTCDFSGITLYDEGSDFFHGYYPGQGLYSIKENPINIFQDKQGNYWTLHSPGGLTFRLKPRGFETINTAPQSYWRTTVDNITAIGSDAAGNWWFGNHHNGIDIFDWNKGGVRTFKYNSKNKNGIGKGTIFHIFTDSEGTVWLGSNLGSLQYFNVADSNFISYRHIPNDPNSISGNDVRYIHEDSDGNLWLVVHGKGIDKFTMEGNTFRNYNEDNSNLSGNWTYQVLQDQGENVWVATSWGLNKLSRGEDYFVNYFYDVKDSTSISNNEINCLFEDSKGRIWAGTSDGLNLYVGSSDSFVRYKKGFKNSFICSIQEDANGGLWLSTHDGLVMFNPDTYQIFNFDRSDGLQVGEYNPRATYKNTENTIFFGGISGADKFNPEDLFYNTTIPPVYISKFKLFNEEIIDYTKNSILDKNVIFEDEITLEYSQNVIGFEYFASNLINPEKTLYKYKMEGFDKDWNDVGPKREATYTNLDPGKYVFRVQASNNDRVWNDMGASVSIIIKPPWWMTWWFKLLAIFGSTAVLVSFYFIRINQLRNQKLALTKMVDERTKSLNEKNVILKQQSKDLNEINTLLEERQQQVEEQAVKLQYQTDDLKVKNEELERLNVTKDKLFSIVAHDLRNPFHGILSLSDLFSNKFESLSDEEKSKMATYINQSTKVVYSLLDNLLNWARSQTNQIIYQPVDIDIFELICESIKLLENNAEEKEICIELIRKREVLVRIDRDMINTSIRNILSNAIKFTPKKGKITISVEEKQNYAEISISDNGIGMDDTVKNNLFKIEKKNSRLGTDGERGSALGLVLCKDFVERNGGSIEVESEPNNGSMFKFTVPRSSKKIAK